MEQFKATVERGQRFWLVTVDGIGTTQARNLREIDVMAKDLVAVMREVDPADVEVFYDVRMPEEAQAHLVEAERLRAEAASAQARAAAEVRVAAAELKGYGMPLRDIGELLHVSYQRAHQLVTADEGNLSLA